MMSEMGNWILLSFWLPGINRHSRALGNWLFNARKRVVNFPRPFLSETMISSKSQALGETSEPWTFQLSLGNLELHDEPCESLSDYDWLIHLFPQVDKKALNRTYMNEPFQMKRIVWAIWIIFCKESYRRRMNCWMKENIYWQISTRTGLVRRPFLRYWFTLLFPVSNNTYDHLLHV